jgi:alpha-glucosidase
MGQEAWWQGAVIYQIYPASFQDSNGDGWGDLAGIEQRLDYVAELGVDAIWLSPIFASPMRDFGYDASDYRRIDPRFGAMADWERLRDAAHARGLKVLLDHILGHTSTDHAWFQASRRRQEGKDDWYIWADPKPDGTAPNNWLSVFGGTAWTWDALRRQYYLHDFHTTQADLNFHHPEIQEQMLAEVAFWLEQGADGYRLDTVSHYFHDHTLHDNPPRAREGAIPENPYALQWHRYDKARDDNLAFLKRLRAVADRQRALLLGEVVCDDGIGLLGRYLEGGDKLHTGYVLELPSGVPTASALCETIGRIAQSCGEQWPSYALSNHDVPRVVSRLLWAHPDAEPGCMPQMAKAMLVLLLSLRGVCLLYQGEELGLSQAELPREALRDPFTIDFDLGMRGRDGARTPMPWSSAAPNGGFSPAAATWLPMPVAHLALAVDTQQGRDDAPLAVARKLIALRKAHVALREGTMAVSQAGERMMQIRRVHGAEVITSWVNLGPSRQEVPHAGVPLLLAGARQETDRLILEGWGAAVVCGDGEGRSHG